MLLVCVYVCSYHYYLFVFLLSLQAVYTLPNAVCLVICITSYTCATGFIFLSVSIIRITH